jgi:DNA-binding CsgD family transcriptional regulator
MPSPAGRTTGRSALIEDDSAVTALSERDADGLLEGVARIAEPLTLASLREESILVVHSLIPSVSASWNEISSAGSIDAVSTPEFDRWPGMDEAFARALAGHPVIAHIRKTNDGRPRAISDFWSIDEFHSSTLYQELYQRLSTEDQLSFTIPTPDVLIGVAINRDRVGFSGRDRTIANLLRPHILQAYRNAVANEQIGRLMSIVEDLTTDRDAGLVVLSRTGTADEPTPAAAALLSRWFPGQVAAGLPQQVGDWLHSLDGEAARRPTWPLVFEEGGRRLVLRRLQAVRPSDQDVLHVSEHPAGRSGQDLARLGLSRRQAEVVRMAAAGRSNAEIARDLGLSVRTIEGHMGQALERLGVRSRTAAANLIYQLDLRDGQL